MTESVIPEDKLYFKIGEVAKIVGVKPYVLRYWESEFSVIKPGKTRSKHRLYRRKDVETLLRIKDLLHARRFTIEGARRQLKSELGTDFATDVTGTLNKGWTWPVASILAILKIADVNNTKMSISNEGAIQITLDSGLASYKYIIPAQAA